MDYTDVDPSAAVDSLMADKTIEYTWQAFTHKLDSDSLTWCATIAELTDSGDKGVLATAQAASVDEQQAAAVDTSEKFSSKIEGKGIAEKIDAVIVQRKTDWLPQYITQVETEHAQHEALASLADAEGNTEQADAHRLAMLRCEAAQQIALDELKSLS